MRRRPRSRTKPSTTRGCRRASRASTAPTAMPMPEARAIVDHGRELRHRPRARARGRARRLPRAGHARDAPTLLDDLAVEIRASGGECATLAGDVTAVEMPPRLVAAAMQAFGRIDVVVNNAGVGAHRLVARQERCGTRRPVAAARRWRRFGSRGLRYRSSNERAACWCSSARAIARVPLPELRRYALAKAAIRAAAIQLRRELSSRGVGVTYVDPGVVVTEFHVAAGHRAHAVRSAGRPGGSRDPARHRPAIRRRQRRAVADRRDGRSANGRHAGRPTGDQTLHPHAASS